MRIYRQLEGVDSAKRPTDGQSTPAGAAARADRAERVIRAVFPAVLALLATPLMSGIVTFYHLGPAEGFFGRWLEAWAVSVPAGLFVVYVVSPAARRLTERLARQVCHPAQRGARDAAKPRRARRLVLRRRFA